jgi:hypothetical protein
MQLRNAVAVAATAHASHRLRSSSPADSLEQAFAALLPELIATSAIVLQGEKFACEQLGHQDDIAS